MKLTLKLMIVSCSLISIAAADDWPQWRGLNRDGIWKEKGVISEFKSKQIPSRWKVTISAGYSGPTVADGKVFITDRITDPSQIERVLCFDEQTGERLWVHEYDCPYRRVGYQAGPRAAVSIDDGRAYSLGTMGHLYCFETASGRVLWKRDLNTEYKIDMPIWGIASSPLVFEDLVIVQIGGVDACLVALNKRTGEEVWKALDDRASYSSPILTRQAGELIMICWTGDRVVGLAPATGKLHWEYPFQPRRMVLAVATPVLHDEYLFVTGFYDGALMLRVNPDRLAVAKIWRRMGESEFKTDGLHSIMSTPVMAGRHLYGVDSYGELRCLEAETGDRLWETQKATPRARWSNIHFVQNGDRHWLFNERGELIIARLSPQGFDEISRARLIRPTEAQLARRGGVCWAHPAFANRHVFIRNDEELVCASLAE